MPHKALIRSIAEAIAILGPMYVGAYWLGSIRVHSLKGGWTYTDADLLRLASKIPRSDEPGTVDPESE